MSQPQSWTSEELEKVEDEMKKEFSQAPKEVVTLAVRLCRRQMTPGESIAYLIKAVREVLTKREAQMQYA